MRHAERAFHARQAQRRREIHCREIGLREIQRQIALISRVRTRRRARRLGERQHRDGEYGHQGHHVTDTKSQEGSFTDQQS